jgi:hypothetical protein
MTKFTMPAGAYYIGDLCYVMHEDWDEFCELTIEGNNVKDGVFTLKDGTRFATFTTKYGDGSYHSTIGNIGVDAGLVGCIRIGDIKQSDRKNVKDGCAAIFNEEFECFSDGDGTITFGRVVVYTGDEEHDDDYYD